MPGTKKLINTYELLSFIQQIYIEYLLFDRCQEYINEQKKYD